MYVVSGLCMFVFLYVFGIYVSLYVVGPSVIYAARSLSL